MAVHSILIIEILRIWAAKYGYSLNPNGIAISIEK